jgi:hypothetical protein
LGRDACGAILSYLCLQDILNARRASVGWRAAVDSVANGFVHTLRFEYVAGNKVGRAFVRNRVLRAATRKVVTIREDPSQHDPTSLTKAFARTIRSFLSAMTRAYGSNGDRLDGFKFVLCGRELLPTYDCHAFRDAVRRGAVVRIRCAFKDDHPGKGIVFCRRLSKCGVRFDVLPRYIEPLYDLRDGMVIKQARWLRRLDVYFDMLPLPEGMFPNVHAVHMGATDDDAPNRLVDAMRVCGHDVRVVYTQFRVLLLCMRRTGYIFEKEFSRCNIREWVVMPSRPSELAAWQVRDSLDRVRVEAFARRLPSLCILRLNHEDGGAWIRLCPEPDRVLLVYGWEDSLLYRQSIE